MLSIILPSPSQESHYTNDSMTLGFTTKRNSKWQSSIKYGQENEGKTIDLLTSLRETSLKEWLNWSMEILKLRRPSIMGERKANLDDRNNIFIMDRCKKDNSFNLREGSNQN